MLDNIKDILNRLTKRQQVILAMSTIFSAVGILLMALVATKTQLALLYSGLDEKTVAELVDKLDTMNVEHSFKDGAVYVDKAKRDRIRLELAKEGLPKRGQSGYELLDDISGFGTTSEMFEATYWRAKEGEIARTLIGIEEIEDARVHIAPQVKAAFVREGNQPSSSVMIKMRGGASPSKEVANSVKYMVALAVRGMDIAHVTVVDATSGRVIGSNSSDPETARIEKRIELEQMMGSNLESLLGAYVGRDKVKVQVSVDLNNGATITREKIIDPNSRVVISTANSEEKETSTEGKSGDVSVQNNIPEGNNANSGDSSSSSRTGFEEKVNYEVSQTEVEQHQSPGDVKRLSVAVMVDGILETDAEGNETWRPRTEEELKSVEDLVKSAAGFDPKRGDTVTVKSLEFAKLPELTPATNGIIAILSENFELMIEVIALLLSIAGISFGIVKPILNMGGDSKHKEEIAKLRKMYEEQIQALLPEEEEEEVVNPMQLLITQLEGAIAEDPEEALTIIRGWLHSVSEADFDDNSRKTRA